MGVKGRVLEEREMNGDSGIEDGEEEEDRGLPSSF